METLGMMGFMFSLPAFVMAILAAAQVGKLKKDFDALKAEVELLRRSQSD